MNKRNLTISYCTECDAFCLTTHATELHSYNVKYRWDGHEYQWVNDEMYDTEGVSEECPQCGTETSHVSITPDVARILLQVTDADILYLPIDHDAFIVGIDVFDDVTLVKKAIAQSMLEE
jgi:hypothetical protein